MRAGTSAGATAVSVVGGLAPLCLLTEIGLQENLLPPFPTAKGERTEGEEPPSKKAKGDSDLMYKLQEVMELLETATDRQVCVSKPVLDMVFTLSRSR